VPKRTLTRAPEALFAHVLTSRRCLTTPPSQGVVLPDTPPNRSSAACGGDRGWRLSFSSRARSGPVLAATRGLAAVLARATLAGAVVNLILLIALSDLPNPSAFSAALSNLFRNLSADSVFLARPKLADYVASREELRWRAGEVFDAIRAGSLRITIGGRYPLATRLPTLRKHTKDTCRVGAPPANCCC
jgi:hypothetical protein